MERNGHDTGHTEVKTRAGLVLRLDPTLSPEVRALVEQEAEALGEKLRHWGRFRLPVRVQAVASLADLRVHAPCVTEVPLRALAELDRVVLLQPRADRDLPLLLLHELAHVQCFQRCTPPHAQPPYLPTWFREGLAQTVAQGQPLPRERRDLAELPELLTLLQADDAQIAAQPTHVYLLAWHTFAEWHAHFGHLGLAALYGALRRNRSFPQAFQGACQQTELEFLQTWIQHLQAEAQTA